MFSPKWLVNMFVQVFITMIFIYFIKKASAKFNIPIVSKIAEEV
jgi:uncharacterized membrane protein